MTASPFYGIGVFADLARNPGWCFERAPYGHVIGLDRMAIL
ncbi:hypothetical protein [Cohaesibacter intestini]|nr:hypothetical protein [Cohaesibacter intestini]